MKRRIIFTAICFTAICALALAVAFVYASYRRDIAAARARVASGSLIANTPCGPIEYAVAGNGPPVLVIHGAGGGFDQGLEFSRPLMENGFEVIAVSRFGYLRTPLPADASPAAQADAHACVLDALKLPQAVVFGGSAGAPSAMQLCLRHPQRCSAMVLGVPLAFVQRPASAPPPAPASRLALFLMETTLKSDFAFWITTKLAHDYMVQTILATPPADVRNATADEQDRVEQVLRHIEPISQREQGLRNDSAIAGSLPRYELERFAVPTLVVSVENDGFNTYPSARYTAEHIAGARFIGYRTGGHLWVGHQKELWNEVTKFLKEMPAGTHSGAQEKR